MCVCIRGGIGKIDGIVGIFKSVFKGEAVIA